MGNGQTSCPRPSCEAPRYGKRVSHSCDILLSRTIGYTCTVDGAQKICILTFLIMGLLTEVVGVVIASMFGRPPLTGTTQQHGARWQGTMLAVEGRPPHSNE